MRLKSGLAKTRDAFMGKVNAVLKGKGRLDAATLEELEEALIAADVGARTAARLVDGLRERARGAGREPVDLLREEVTGILRSSAAPLQFAPEGPTVIMVVGVNGTGKTTTVGKLAAKFTREGKKVLVAACDTFRAAAAEQLAVWAERAGVEMISHSLGGDPAAVVYDAAVAARSRKIDVLLVDTAGRLHTKTNLMEELKKIRRVVAREIQGAPHEVLLVLDAVGGQNGVAQARIFTDAVGVTGIVLTKLDGSAKGGVILGIGQELGIPVKLIGIGEGVEDLRDFEPDEFAAALLGAY